MGVLLGVFLEGLFHGMVVRVEREKEAASICEGGHRKRAPKNPAKNPVEKGVSEAVGSIPLRKENRRKNRGKNRETES